MSQDLSFAQVFPRGTTYQTDYDTQLTQVRAFGDSYMKSNVLEVEGRLYMYYKSNMGWETCIS